MEDNGKRLDGVETEVKNLRAEIRGMREVIGTAEHPKLITIETHAALEKRVRQIEETLAIQQEAASS